MKYRVMIYCNNRPLDALPGSRFNRRTHGSLVRTGIPRAQALSLDSQQWSPAAAACTVRVREGQTSVVDSPCAETRGYLGGFLIEAAARDEAVLMASAFPWARTGEIEIRPVREIKLVRQRAGV